MKHAITELETVLDMYEHNQGITPTESRAEKIMDIEKSIRMLKAQELLEIEMLSQDSLYGFGVPVDPVDLKIEAKARQIYESWSNDIEYKPWVERGNSDKQRQARKMAREVYSDIPGVEQDQEVWDELDPKKACVVGEEGCESCS